MQEGTIARWRKREGDPVKTGEPIMEVETDKATMELNSYHDGVVAKILLDDGGSAPVGQVVGLLAKTGEDPQAVAASAAGGASQDGKAGPAQAGGASAAPAAGQQAQAAAPPPAQPQPPAP